MTVPLRLDQAVERPAETLPIDEQPSRPLRILVVEDNEINLRMVTKVLLNAGHEVTIARDGEEAVRLFQDKSFDLVLMDVNLPVLDGLTATERIRSLEEQSEIRTPIVAVTAFAMPEDKDRCLDAGMDVYLSKPIKPAVLLETIATLTSRESMKRTIIH